MKRTLFDEISEGFDALQKERQGKVNHQGMAEIEFLRHRVKVLEQERDGKALVEFHAIDHLSDFVQCAADVHPAGVSSQYASDLRTIGAAIRDVAGTPGILGLKAALTALRDVFDRYGDYRDKPVTLVDMFELAEWILSGNAEVEHGGPLYSIIARANASRSKAT